MTKTLTASVRKLLVASALVGLTASVASAQITFAGTTQFQINGVGGFGNTKQVGGTLGDGLTFTGTSFTATTVPTGPGTSTVHIPGVLGNNVGTVFLKDRFFNYAGTVVQMLITFTAPILPGGQQQTFSSTLTGLVHNSTTNFPGDNVVITWSPGIFNIPFTNGPGSGSFSMVIDQDQTFLGTHTSYLAADITAVTPEPASLVLLATGLVGVFGVAVRRRNA